LSNSLYDISVGSYQQAIGGMITVLAKGAKYAEENDLDADDFVGLKLYDDMLPFLFQVNCARMHTLDALAALKSGEFIAPNSITPRDYQGLQNMLLETLNELDAVSADEVNSAQDDTIIFEFGEREISFTAEILFCRFHIRI